ALLLTACAGTAPAGGSPKIETKTSGGQPAAQAQAGGGAAIQGDAASGRQLFSSKGCIACHVAPGVPGATGTIGPSLAGIGDPAKRPTLADGGANTPAHIKEWIQDPQQLKPGTMMPDLQLSDKEASDLTAFLLTLK
ncbi:MAG: c-type cytochrome, partial [Chloroflexota bacterium]|nr:c-type cytochrome [Chloroflexota bacterium]